MLLSVGAIAISNDGGRVVLTEAGSTVQLTSFNQSPPPPIILSQAEISSRFVGALNALPPSRASDPGDNSPSDQGSDEDQSSNAEEDQALQEAIKEAKEATEELKQHAEGKDAKEGKQEGEKGKRWRQPLT